MRAAPAHDYAGAEYVFAVSAVLASLVVVFPPDGSEWTGNLPLKSTYCGIAGVSAAVSSRLLGPLARRLVAHQYFFRPVVVGTLVVVLAHALFGLIFALLAELWSALADQPYQFDAQRLLMIGVGLSSFGFVFLSYITLPAGILAAYCVEILGWYREGDFDQRSTLTANPKVSEEAKAVE